MQCDIPPDEIRYEQEALGPIGTWEWVVGGRQPDLAPFRGKPGLSLDIERNAEMDYFNCFVDEEMLRHITTETNRYARQMLDNHTLAPHSRAQDWTPVTVEEMRTFLGLVVAMGLVKQRDIKDYWCVDDVTDTPFSGVSCLATNFCWYCSSFTWTIIKDPCLEITLITTNCSKCGLYMTC